MSGTLHEALHDACAAAHSLRDALEELPPAAWLLAENGGTSDERALLVALFAQIEGFSDYCHLAYHHARRSGAITN